MTDSTELMRKPVCRVFRRAYIKRRYKDPYYSETLIKKDNFNSSNMVALSAHTSDSGGSWTHTDNYVCQYISSLGYGIATNSTAGTGATTGALGTETPPSANYWAQAECSNASSSETLSGVGVRAFIATGLNGYFMYLQAFDVMGASRWKWVVCRYDAGVETELAASADQVGVSGFKKIKIQASGTTIKAWLDDVEVASVTDATHAGVGTVAILSYKFHANAPNGNVSKFIAREIPVLVKPAGSYEDDWYEISQYVKTFGSAEITTDDVRLNQFIHSGITLRCRNDRSSFEDENNEGSLWYGYMTRARTLVKVEAGYYDAFWNEQTDDASVGVFILDDEIPISYETNDVDLMCKSIVAPLEAERADEIAGLTNSMTASQFFTLVRDATDGGGNYLFRNFVTTAAWTIATTTSIYTGILAESPNYSVWELMVKMAEAENFVVNATRVGGIEFRNREPNTTAPAAYLYGNTFIKPNIISVEWSKQAVNTLFTNFRLKYLEADTTTSYVTKGVSTAIDATNVSWIYGRRSYEFENTFFNTATAQAVVDNLFAEFSVLRQVASIVTKFHPGIDVMDRVRVNHRTLALTDVGLWNMDVWATDAATTGSVGLTWDDQEYGLELVDSDFVVLSMTHDLDRLTTQLLLRRL